MTLYRRLLPYCLSVGSTVIALSLSLVLETVINRTIGAFFYLAIAISTWYGGLRPGIVAIILSVLALDYYFIPPPYQFAVDHIDDFVRLTLFVIVSLIITLLSANLRTSRQRIEQLSRKLIEESSDRLKTVLNAAQVGMWDWDMVTQEITWSPEHEQLFGLPSGTFDGRYETFDACLHPDDRDGLHQAIAEALKQHRPYLHEYRVVWANGSIHWIEGRGQVFYNEAGQPIRMSGTIMAIDERKQAQLLLQDRETTLRLFIQHVPAGIAMFDRQMKYLMTSQRWLDDHCSDPTQSLIGRSHYEAFPTIPVRWKQAHQQTLAGTIQKCEEDIFLRADGVQLWVRWEMHPWHTPLGEIGGIIILAENITERKQAKVALEQLNLDLEQRVAERTNALQQQTQQEQLLWNITQTIRQSLELNVTLNAAVMQVRKLLQVDRATIYRFNPNWSGDFIAESVDSNWVQLVQPNQCRIWEDTYLQETAGGRFRNSETLAVSDIYAANLQSCHIQLLEQFQARAYAIAPLFVGESLWGLFAIYQNNGPRIWQPWEMELLQQIASQLAIAIQQSELYEQLQVELQERQQAETTSREAEQRWRSLFESANLAVISTDSTGKIYAANPFFLKLTGHDKHEIIGCNWFDLFVSTDQASDKLLTQPDLDQDIYPTFQSEIRTKSGETRVINWTNTLLRNSKNQVIGLTGIGEDITQRQAVETLKNEFISIVSHELRTPLTSIRGSLGLLATGVMDDEPSEMKRMIEIAAIDTERLVRLVNDVLDLEKLESGKVSLAREWCNAADLMQRSQTIMESSAQESDVQLIVHPRSVQLWVAPDRIIQTITNLLSNAIKFSPPGSLVILSAEIKHDGKVTKPGDRTPKPTSAYHFSASHLLFSVQDQGRGIPVEKLDNIFGRFQQVDASDSRDKGGTGLGLAICKSIIQQHDGQIWVESVWGQGSTFFFTLPLHPN